MDTLTVSEPKIVQRYGHPRWICSNTATQLTYSSDDRFLLSYYRSNYTNVHSRIEIFNADTGHAIHELTSINARHFATADNKLLLADPTHLYLAAYDDLKSTISQEFDKDIVAIALSNDAKTVAVAFHDNSFILLDSALTILAELSLEHSVNALYFLDQSSDAPAQLAISASTNRTHRLLLLHLSDYSMLELKGARAKVSQVFATGNSVYAAGGKSILAWPRTGGKAAALFQCDHNSQLVGLHNSTLVIKQSDKMLSAIDRHNGEERWQHPLITYSMVCMRQNRLAIDYRGELLILDSERGDLIQKTTCAPFVSNIALNHRADRLSLSGHGHRINHWSLDNAEITPANNPDGELKQLYIIDSERWVSAHNDQILFWNKHHHQPYKTIYPSSISFNTFVIDDEREQLWVASSKLQCYCLNSGKLLSNFVNHYPTPCRVLRIIDDQRLLFVSEGGRRNLGHLLVVSRDNGEVLHRERIEMMFFDAVREGNSFYLSAKSGPQYRFDVSDYSYTRVTDYASRLSHGGLYINHNPIRTASPLHQVYIEYGAEPDLPESQNRCCIFTATDVNNDRLMIPQLRFDDLITCAHIFADDKRAVLAMRKKEKTSPPQPQYLQIVELESAAVTARLTLDVEGVNDRARARMFIFHPNLGFPPISPAPNRQHSWQPFSACA